MRRLLRLLVATLVAGVLLGGGSRAEAKGGKAEARMHAMRGVALFKRGMFEKAIASLEKAESSFHAPPHLLYIARAKRELGQLHEAHDRFVDIMLDELADGAPKAFTRAQQEARDEASELRQRIATVLIEIDGAEEREVEVTIDGKAIAPPKLEYPIAVTTDEHVIAATATKGGQAERTVSGREGVTQTVSLDVALGDGGELYDLAEAVLPDEPDESAGGSLDGPLWPSITLGIGGATLLVGAILGGVTLGEASDIKDQCRDDICPTELAEDGDSAETLGHTSTALVVIGSVITAAGATWLTINLLSSSSSDDTASARLTTHLGLGSARLKLSW